MIGDQPQKYWSHLNIRHAYTFDSRAIHIELLRNYCNEQYISFVYLKIQTTQIGDFLEFHIVETEVEGELLFSGAENWLN